MKPFCPVSTRAHRSSVSTAVVETTAVPGTNLILNTAVYQPVAPVVQMINLEIFWNFQFSDTHAWLRISVQSHDLVPIHSHSMREGVSVSKALIISIVIKIHEISMVECKGTPRPFSRDNKARGKHRSGNRRKRKKTPVLTSSCVTNQTRLERVVPTAVLPERSRVTSKLDDMTTHNTQHTPEDDAKAIW